RNPFAYCKGVFPCCPAPPAPGVKKPPKNWPKKTTPKKKKKTTPLKKHTKKTYNTQRGGVPVFYFDKKMPRALLKK
ncbi:hypothetical protein, partial [Enterobacter intestinihominis]